MAVFLTRDILNSIFQSISSIVPQQTECALLPLSQVEALLLVKTNMLIVSLLQGEQTHAPTLGLLCF